MNKELMKLIKRQSVIVGKLRKNEATDAEQKELDVLNKKIEELTNPESVDVGKTELATMTVAEFQLVFCGFARGGMLSGEGEPDGHGDACRK